MARLRYLIAVSSVVVLMTGACGGEPESGDSGLAEPTTSTENEAPVTTETDTTPGDEPTAEQQDDEDPNQDTSGLSGEGTFAVDGEETDTEWVVRCAPSDDFGGNPDERDLQLIAYSSDGGFLTLEVDVEDLEGLGENDYTYNTFGFDWGKSLVEEEIFGFTTGPDGDWYFGVDPIQLALGAQTTDPLDPPPFTIEGDRIVGRVDIAGIDPEQPDGATFEFDLSIPPEPFDCSEL